MTLDWPSVLTEAIGWASTVSFLISILVPNRRHLHQLGLFASVTTGVYAYAHGATAIWVKWFIAFFFHAVMIYRTQRDRAGQSKNLASASDATSADRTSR